MDRKPGKLSGGERQRVALGRAMVRDPRAYLFDEPLSALDALLRLEMRIELKHMQRDLGRTLVYVTHDQIEAMSMPDRVAVLREGVIQQVASPEDIYNQPANRFVATVVGSPADELPARHRGVERRRARAAATRPCACAPPPPCQTACRATWPTARPPGSAYAPRTSRSSSPGNSAVDATVYVTEPLGGETVVDLHLAERVLKALRTGNHPVGRDQPVGLKLDPKRLHLFAEDGAALHLRRGTDAFTVEAVRAPA